MKKKMELESFGKINLSLDVVGVRSDGMHNVDMIMQAISLSDKVSVGFKCRGKGADSEIKVKTNRRYLPTDRRNIAYRAAEIMCELYKEKTGQGAFVDINIKKIIPVAAGLAGGSGNGAVVLLALNELMGLRQSLPELCHKGEALGQDVPFAVVSAAKVNGGLSPAVSEHHTAAAAVRATGLGSEIKKVTPIKKAVLLVKPSISISTAEAYKGIDSCRILQHPNIDSMEKALKEENFQEARKNMVNVLENWTLKKAEVAEIREMLIEKFPNSPVLMSGSGPTIFVLLDRVREAKDASRELRNQGYKAYWAVTLQ